MTAAAAGARAARPVGLPGRVWARVRPNLFIKSIGVSAFMALFFVAYFYILRRPSAPYIEMPLTELDRWVPFVPWSLPIYASLWFYVSIPPSLMVTLGSLIRYGVAAAIMCGVGLTCFVLWPTAVPPAVVDWAQHPGFAFLKTADIGGNACPSLHVASAIFSCFWLRWLMIEMRAGRAWRVVNVLWCVAIVYSTMATRQHVALDVLAGAVLGTAIAIPSRSWVAPRAGLA